MPSLRLILIRQNRKTINLGELGLPYFLILDIASFELLDPSLIVLLLVGIVVGIVAALLGIGGGLLMVPALNVWGATPLNAIATSLVGIALSSTSGSIQNWRMKHLSFERVALLAPPAMLTTELGVWISNQLPENLLLISFAILQIASIFLISLKRNLKKVEVPREVVQPPLYPPGPTFSGRGSNVMQQPKAQYVARSSSQEGFQKRDNNEILQTQGIGLLAGVLSGLFGVGGGIVMVPLQMLFLGEDIKGAVRTSLGAISLISVWAVGRHALSGNVLWSAGICLGIGGLIGAQLGTRMLPKLPDRLVNLLFRVLLLSMATYMVIKALER